MTEKRCERKFLSAQSMQHLFFNYLKYFLLENEILLFWDGNKRRLDHMEYFFLQELNWLSTKQK